MIIKEMYVFGDMYQNIETHDNIEQCIKCGKVVNIKTKEGDNIVINSSYIVSYII